MVVKFFKICSSKSLLVVCFFVARMAKQNHRCKRLDNFLFHLCFFLFAALFTDCLFSIITYECAKFGGLFPVVLPTAVTVRPDRPLFPVPFGMPKPKRPVKDSGLLGESQGVSLAVGCVSEQVPRRASEPERADV